MVLKPRKNYSNPLSGFVFPTSEKQTIGVPLKMKLVMVLAQLFFNSALCSFFIKDDTQKVTTWGLWH